MIPAEILKGLDNDQAFAAANIDGPVCANAGPGSGKTRALTHSIAYRIASGVDPSTIKAITFTNKAKKEIQDRLAKMIGVALAKQVYVGTYHGFLQSHVLMPNRKHEVIKSLGYVNGFVIADQDDADKLLSESVKASSGYMKVFADTIELTEREIKSFMSKHRANGYQVDDYMAHVNNTQKDVLAKFAALKPNLKVLHASPGSEYDKQKILSAIEDEPRIKEFCILSMWRAYEKKLISSNALDYDGMMVVAKILLSRDEKLAKEISNECQHILLDEFQDTNNVQWDCMKLLIDKLDVKRVFVVGDPDQCIYQFRNANPQIMREFDVIIPGAVMCYLGHNYRSTPENVALCNQIKGFIDPRNLKHPAKAHQPSINSIPSYFFFEDEKNEASFVVEQIQQKLSQGVAPEKIAVLYRGKAQNRIIEKALVDGGLAYHIVGDTSFYETKEVKDVIAVMRMMVTENDILGFARGLSGCNVGVNGLKMRMDIDTSLESGIRMTPLKYLEERFHTKSSTEKSKEKMIFLHRLKGLMSKHKDLTEKRYIQLHIQQGYRENGMQDAHLISENDAYEIYLKTKSAGLNHPLFDSDMLEQRKMYHAKVVAELRDFYNDYCYEKLVKYSQQTDKKSGEHDPARLAERTENVAQLFKAIEQSLNSGLSFEEAINELLLLTEQNVVDVSDKIQLMTIHASKGLEFDTVFLVGTEQRSYFNQHAKDTAFEDEACALFVAASRAEKVNVITGASGRTINGNYDRSGEELCFIQKLAPNLLQKNIVSQSEQVGSRQYTSTINDYEAGSPTPESSGLNSAIRRLSGRAL